MEACKAAAILHQRQNKEQQMIKYIVVSPSKWVDVCAANHINRSHILSVPTLNPIEINTIIKAMFRTNMDDTPIALHLRSFEKLLKAFPCFEETVIGKVEE